MKKTLSETVRKIKKNQIKNRANWDFYSSQVYESYTAIGQKAHLVQ